MSDVEKLKEWANKSVKAKEEWARKLGKSWKAVVFKKFINKPWGHEFIIDEYVRWTVKVLHVEKDHRTSLHYHAEKFEVIFYLEGSFEVLPPLVIHRFVGPIDVLEVSIGDDKDIVRLEDDYGRETKG